MITHANKSQENNNQTAAPSVNQTESAGEQVFQLIDDRSATASQNQLQDLANNTKKATQFKSLQNMANQRSEASMLAQLQTKAEKKSLPNQVTQLESDAGSLIDKLDNGKDAVQLATDNNNETDKPTLSLQKPGETNTTQLAKGGAASSGGGSSQGNRTGMPDNLKSGIESLSGMSMDHVRVHRNSDAPAQLNAHAYAQGSDIHVGPGQEKHLPHEAWHVVQQAQGRVQPTRQMKGKVNINDDTGLEKEADVMGAKALRAGSTIQGKFSGLSFSSPEQQESNNSGGVVQGLFGLSNPFSGLFGGKKKTNEKDGAATNNATVADVAEPEETEDNEEIEDIEETEDKENIGEEKANEEPTSPVVNESAKTYKYKTQYWVTEPDRLRVTDKIQEQTTEEKNLSKADAELMLNKGKTKSAGMLDSILGVVGLGKQESLLGPKLDPSKNKFYYPAMVDESSKISKKWKPIQIRKPRFPNENFKSKYASIKKVDGFYPISKMVAMPHDYNAFLLDLKTKKEKTEEESKKQGNETASAKPLENKAEGTSVSSEDAMEQNIVKEADQIGATTDVTAESSLEEAPTKENELQEDVEKAEEGKLDLFKKYGKRIFTFATKFSFVRVWVNEQLQAGGSAFNELALKAKEKAQSVPLLGSLTLVTKPEGTRVTPEGVTFNFGVKFPIGDKEVELSTQLFTDTQSDYSTSYIGSSAKGIAFSLGGDGDGPKFETNLGTLTHHFGSESSSYVNSSGGSASLSWGTGSGSVKWNSLSFSASQTPKIKGDLSSLALGFDIFGSKANFEISNPKLKDNKLEFTEAKATLDKFEPFSGFEVGPQEVKLTPREKKYDITGVTDLKLTKEIIQEASGKVNLSRIEEKFNLNLTNGTLKVAFLGQTIDIAGVNYDSKADATKVSANTAVLNLDFNNPIGAGDVKATGTITNPSVSSAGFGFTSASVVNDAPINLFNALTFDKIDAIVNSDGSYGGQGDFSATKGEIIQSATGKVAVSRAAGEGAKTKYSLSDGVVGVKFGNQNLTVNGIEYNSDIPGQVKAKNAKANFDIPNPTSAERILADGTLRSPKVTKDGFDFLVGDFKSVSGVNFFNELKLEKIHFAVFPAGKNIQGQANLSKGDGATAVTSANGLFNINGSYEKGGAIKFSLTNGDLGVKFLGQHLDITGVKYDSGDPTKVSAESAELKLDLDNPLGAERVKATGTITKPEVSSTGFGFEKANVVSDAPINLFNALTFSDIDATVKQDESYSGQGTVSATTGSVVKTATGKVGVSRDAAAGSKTKYTLSNGAITVDFGLGEASLSGVNYSSEKPNEVAMNNGKLTTNILGKTITLDVEGAKLLPGGVFDYEKVKGTLSDLSFGEAAKFTNIEVAYDKATETLTGTTAFNLQSGFGGFTATSSGNVTVTKKGQESSLSLAGASLNLKLGAQELDLKEMKYDAGTLSVPQAILKFDIFGKKIEGQVNDGAVNKDGFTYSSASLKLNSSIDFGLAKATIGTVTATKTPEGTTISGDGGISVGGGTVLGISIPELSGKGVISHTFPKGGGAGTTEKELQQVGGKLPDIRLPEALLPSSLWPFTVDIPIPVAPGVSVNIFAGLKGFLSLKGTEITVTKKAEGIYIFNAKLDKAEAELSAAIGAGVMVGNPLIASMMLGIEAAGGIKAEFDASFTKEINTNETKLFALGESESDYGVKGDIELSASLVLEGRALYFLKKRKEKLLGKKVLGSFVGKKGEGFKFSQPTEALMSKEDHANEAKEMLPASFADMTLEQLKLETPQDKRFSAEETENAVEGLAKNADGNPNKKMTILGDFLYDRVDFDKLQNALSQLTRLPVNVEEPETTVPENDDPKSFFTKLRESKLVKVVQAQLEHKQIRDQIGESINLKSEMIISYKNAIEEANPANKTDHLELHGIYDSLNEFKRNFHSGLVGDTAKGFVSKLGSAVKGVFGGETLEEIGAGLMAEIPTIKTTRNRMNAIQATVDAPSASPRP